MHEKQNTIVTKEGFKLHARVIKNKDIDTVFEAKNIIEKAHEIAEKIRNEAQLEAQEFIEETRLKTRQIIEEATQKAKKKEKSILADQQKKAAEHAIAEILDLVASIRAQLENSNELISKLIISVCHKVLGKLERPEFFINLIQAGITDLQGQTGLIIRVNPSDQEFARNAINEISHTPGSGAIERLEADNNLALGSCHILSEGGLLDISLECQLKNIVEELNKMNIKSTI